MALPPLRIQFISWDKDEDGVKTDVVRWERWWREAMREREAMSGAGRWILAKPKTIGVRDPPGDADLQIHFGMPLYGAFPWSHVNWLWMRAGCVWNKAHDGYLERVDAVIWETEEDADAFRKDHAEVADSVWTVSFEGGGKDKGGKDTEERQRWVEEVAEQVRSRRPSRGVRHLPPVLERADCPPITIITPTFQRKKLMEIAFHNLLMTDYPLDKIEWIVVEDNDRSPHVMKRALDEFQAKIPRLRIQYIALEGRRTIGEKRNVGVRAASHEWVLFMDDDDHYPATSFRRRMAWLLRGAVKGAPARVACCTTIAMYDLKRGVSAVNVPPPGLRLCERISEATLTFHRSVWEERPFPEVSVSEGEGWLAGRESVVIEIPPQQIIVAFTHGANQSSRRLPPSDQPPACFWNFPKEYLVFIHGLVGVEIASDSS
jgi:hypothetical protein